MPAAAARNNHGGRPLEAYLSALDRGDLPNEVLDTLRVRQLGWTLGTPESLSVGPVGRLTFPLIWVGDHWDQGVDYVAKLMNRTARERTVLFGRSPPSDIGPRLRHEGALTYAREDLPTWLLELIRDALLRLESGRSELWWAGLRSLKQATAENAIETLIRVAEIAGKLLGANDVELLIRKDAESDVCVLQPDRHRAWLVPWKQHARQDPTPFFNAAARFDGQVVLPCLDHATCFGDAPLDDGGGRGALATLFKMGEAWQGALLLRWTDPFLPNPVEIATLEALSAGATAAWTHVRLLIEAEMIDPLASFMELITHDDSPDAPDRGAPNRGRLASERALLRACATVAQADAATLFLRDSEEGAERLYLACHWRAGAKPTPHGAIRLDCPSAPESWKARIEEALVPHNRSEMVCLALMLPNDQKGISKGVVALCFPSPENRYVDLSSDMRAKAAETLLCYGWPLVELSVRQRAQTASDGLLKVLADADTVRISDLLLAAGRLVKSATGCDQVFVQCGDEVVGVPENHAAKSIEAGSSSLTAEAQRRNKTIRILDFSDAEHSLRSAVNEAGYKKLVKGLGWSAIRSMIISPIGHDMGIIKACSKEDGVFLTPADTQLVARIADRLSNMVKPIRERAALDALNKVAMQSAGLSGKRLAENLVAQLESWASRYVRPNVRVFILAYSESGIPIAAAGSAVLGDSQAALKSCHDDRKPGIKCGDLHIVRERLGLPGGHALSGSLFFGHRSALADGARALIREAARELSVLLHGESVRQELLQQQGMLRHGLIGPVQGVITHALFLAKELGETAQLSEETSQSIRAIHDEIHQVRLWREGHRLSTSLQSRNRLEIRTRRAPLRPFVEACVERFREAAKERNLRLTLALPPGSVQVEFDPEAMNVALSNLLDNAIKYAFYNREITVGVQMQRRLVEIWVEDIGHGIAEERRETIYQPGGRARQSDPLRVIRGDGIGLYMAKRVAFAHDGALTHSCELIGKQSGDTAPRRVRFTLTLPGG